MEVKSTILVADDEQDILEIIKYTLEKEGYKVYTASNGQQALELAHQLHPQLMILDIMMPHKTGIDVCRILRKEAAFKETMIIILTALNDEITHIRGLDSGADDYISKPVSQKVLASRVNAMFRRVQKPDENKTVSVGNIIIDPEKFIVSIDGTEVILAKKEFELLYLLASKPGRVFLRNEILNMVWGTEVIVGDRTIDVHIRKIRQKLGIDCVTTVKGVGYKFEL